MDEERAYLDEYLKELSEVPAEDHYLVLYPRNVQRQLQSKFFRCRVFDIKGRKCEVCGSPNIQIHHKTYELFVPITVQRTNNKIRAKRHNSNSKNIRKRHFFYSNEDQKWAIIENKFPDHFKKNIESVSVLCGECHLKEHKRLQKETGSFIPLKDTQYN